MSRVDSAILKTNAELVVFYYCEDHKKYSKPMICADGREMPRLPSGECRCRSLSEWVQEYKQFCCAGATATATPTPTTGQNTPTLTPSLTVTPTPVCLQQNDVCGGAVNCCSGLRCEQGNPRLCKPIPTSIFVGLTTIPISGIVRINPSPTLVVAQGCLEVCGRGLPQCSNGTSCLDLKKNQPCDTQDPLGDCKCVRQTDGCASIPDRNEQVKCYCIDKSFCSDDRRKEGCDGSQSSCPTYYACKPNPDLCGRYPIPGGSGFVSCLDPKLFCFHYPQFCGCVDEVSCPRFPQSSGVQLGNTIRTENPNLYNFILRSSNQVLRNLIGQ
ncbi:MAG: hypothetical protein UZ22_OP11002000389 [Microgenomates bacterium OLB23]|nr:MAG: hypothetical protein UZ22_OP11002000389 [Microgenomates bacterium OLB23]